MCFLTESFPYMLSKRNRSPIWPSLKKTCVEGERELISAPASQGNYDWGGARQHDDGVEGGRWSSKLSAVKWHLRKTKSNTLSVPK